MNDVHKAKPNDVFVDVDGKLWRVISICGEPTVSMREIECTEQIRAGKTFYPPVEKRGGISGQMWEGFKRIYEQPERKIESY